MKVAIVYDRVNKWGGAERVLLALHDIFPKAPLYTSVYSAKYAPWAQVFPQVYTSFLQKIPLIREHHEWLALLMPLAFEQFDFSEYDLVISVTSEAAKGIITHPGTRHICYCLTPTRYLWSGHEIYFHNRIKRFFIKWLLSYLKSWDKMAAQRPDEMVAISEAVRNRVDKYYGRKSKVVYPPVNLDVRGLSLEFSKKSKIQNLKSKNYFLVVSRLVSYKRIDLVVKTFNKLGWPLVIVGTGSQYRKLSKMAKNNIYFAGHLTDSELVAYYKKAQVLIFPQEEDFGIVAVEAQMCGTPVIAYKGGGALETVVAGKTGEFFTEQTVESLARTIKNFKRENYDVKIIQAHTRRFSQRMFVQKFKRLINE
ncbi:glycosyltransferase [Candidatus Microgenomates bacterium]|nr:glycosyltransferase [Candidatus Microgenomates bacterium]